MVTQKESPAKPDSTHVWTAIDPLEKNPVLSKLRDVIEALQKGKWLITRLHTEDFVDTNHQALAYFRNRGIQGMSVSSLDFVEWSANDIQEKFGLHFALKTAGNLAMQRYFPDDQVNLTILDALADTFQSDKSALRKSFRTYSSLQQNAFVELVKNFPDEKFMILFEDFEPLITELEYGEFDDPQREMNFWNILETLIALPNVQVIFDLCAGSRLTETVQLLLDKKRKVEVIEL